MTPANPGSDGTRKSTSHISVTQLQCVCVFFNGKPSFCLPRCPVIFLRGFTEPVPWKLGGNDQDLEGWIIGHSSIEVVSLHCLFRSGCLSQLLFLGIFPKFISLRALGSSLLSLVTPCRLPDLHKWEVSSFSVRVFPAEAFVESSQCFLGNNLCFWKQLVGRTTLTFPSSFSFPVSGNHRASERGIFRGNKPSLKC